MLVTCNNCGTYYAERDTQGNCYTCYMASDQSEADLLRVEMRNYAAAFDLWGDIEDHIAVLDCMAQLQEITDAV